MAAFQIGLKSTLHDDWNPVEISLHAALLDVSKKVQVLTRLVFKSGVDGQQAYQTLTQRWESIVCPGIPFSVSITIQIHV